MSMCKHLTLPVTAGVALFIFFVLSFAPVTAQDAQPSFQVVDVGASYAITGTKELTSGVRLLLQNTTSATINLVVKVDSLQSVDKKGQPVRLRIADEITGSNQIAVVLAPAETKVLTMTAPALVEKNLEAGVYTGLLLVWDKKRGNERATTLRLTVPPKPDPALAEPLVEKWKLFGYRHPAFTTTFPFLSMTVLRWDNEFLPLTQAVTKTDTLTTGTALGKVIKDNEDLSFVYWTGISQTVDVPAIQLGFFLTKTSALTGAVAAHLLPGKYEGTIKLHPKDKSEAKLEVNVTDSFGYPLFVLLLGIGVALLVTQYTNVRSKIQGARTTREELVKKSQALEFGKYTIQADLRSSLDNALKLLKHKQWKFKMVWDEKDPTYVEAQGLLTQAEQAIEEWPGFANELVALKDELAKIDFPEKPAFVIEAQKLLEPAGERKLSLADFLTLRQKVLNATKLAQQWPTLNQTVQAHEAWIQKLEGHVPEEDHKLLGLARRIVSEARWEIWHVNSLEEMDKRQTEQDAEKAERVLAQLNFYLSKPPKVEKSIQNGIMPKHERDISVNLAEQFQELFEQPKPVPAASDADFGQHRLAWNSGLVLIYLLLAAYAGMQQLYIGKLFGTPLDYLAVFLWGIGAKVTLDALYTALDGFAGLMALRKAA